MEKFLKDYVTTYAEASGRRLSGKQISQIVNTLMNYDELWDTVDSYVLEIIKEVEK